MMFDEAILQNLYRYCYSLTGDEHSAHDLLQGTLEKFIKKTPRPRNLLAYIKKSIRNQFIDNYRKEQRVKFESLDETVIPTDFDMKTLEYIVINEDLVEQIICLLNPDEREILFFWAIDGMTAAQIAEQIGVPRGTILSKIFRMRKKIVEQFDVESIGTVEGTS